MAVGAVLGDGELGGVAEEFVEDVGPSCTVTRCSTVLC